VPSPAAWSRPLRTLAWPDVFDHVYGASAGAPPTLKLALRASTALPLSSGRPVALGGRHWFDAGVSESVPLRTALVQGATHVLVLRSRRADEQDTAESVRDAQLVGRYLRRYSPGLEAAFLDRSARLRRADAELDARERDHAGVPAVLSVRPSAGTPSVGRLERDNARAVAGLEAGHGIAHAQICPAVAGTS
jgi:predicted patatin/cPLA2 family phospholipase